MKKNNILIVTIVIVLCTISLYVFANVEVYFSLSDDPESIIIKNIDKAIESLDVAMYSFNDIDIAWSVVNAKNRGVKVRIFLDSKEITAEHSKSRFLINEGVENIRISSNKGLMHNKFVIIDNKTVITGSYNWTASAGERNDENILVINDEKTVKKYRDYFYNLWNKKYSLDGYNQLISHPDINSPDIIETPENIPVFLQYIEKILLYLKSFL